MGNHPVLVSDPTGNVAIDDPSKNIGGDEDGGFPEDYIVAGSDGRQGTTSCNMQDAIGPTGIGGQTCLFLSDATCGLDVTQANQSATNTAPPVSWIKTVEVVSTWALCWGGV